METEGDAIKASSWKQTEDVAVACFSPTRTPTALAFDKSATMSPRRQSGVLEWAVHIALIFYNLNWSLLAMWKCWITKVMYENVFSGGNTGFIRQYFRTITPTDFALHGFHWNYFQSQWIIQSIEEGRTTAEISNVIFQCFELHQKKKKKKSVLLHCIWEFGTSFSCGYIKKLGTENSNCLLSHEGQMGKIYISFYDLGWLAL